MHSHSVRFIAELVRACGVSSDAAVLVVGEPGGDLIELFAQRGVEPASIDGLGALGGLGDCAYEFVIHDSPWSPGPDPNALEELRRVASTGTVLAAPNGAASSLAEVERFFSRRGDRVTVIEDLVLALRMDHAQRPGAEDTPPRDPERLALASVCLAQAAAAAEGGRRLDATLGALEQSRQHLQLAEADADELASKLAQALNALADERREHDALRRRFEGLRSSHAWPALVAGYNLVHQMRRLRAWWARRGHGDDV